jgi:tetratricopeptide (TPR) repeat protein
VKTLPLIALLLLLLAPASDPRIEQENLGVGQMGRFEFDVAAKTFAAIVEQHPDDLDARVNLAIATLNRQKEGDSEAAIKLIDEVMAKDPNHLRARYIRGLLRLNAAKPAEALEDFRFVAENDPRDPYAAYYVAQCLAGAGKHEEALAWYAKASAIDPNLRSAYYGAFQSLQRLRRMEEAKAKLAEFQKLKDHLQARLVEFKYTRMGPKAEVTVSSSARGSPAAQAPKSANARSQPAGPAFAEPVPLPITNADNFAWKNTACVTAADIDGDGKLDLFITAGDHNAVLLNRGDAFELIRDHPLANTEDVNAVLWGDYDNDGLVDVYLARHGPNQLWRQTAKGKWQDVTEQTKTYGGNFETVGGAFFDADHDGDLDLFLVRDNGPNELLNNNGDGTFRELGKETGLAGDGRPSVGVVVNDLDNDGDADLLVRKRRRPHDVFLNERFWKYRRGLTVDDAEGRPEQIVAAVDVNADGQVEEYASRMLDVDGSGMLRPVQFPQFATWEAVVLDPAAGPSIVGIRAGQPMIMRPGPGRQKYMTLSLSGKSKVADQMRSNASGIGVKIAARVGDRWVARDTYPQAGGAGQSLQPVAIGLGGADKADFVRLTWPEGLLQTELNLAAAQNHAIDETQRQTSSCPVLFAWDGEKFAFVSDVLGVGGIGFATGRNEFAPPRPWENFLLPPNALKPRDERFIVKLTEPMEEACYLDSLKLVAWDLPPGWSMALDERMATNDPQPTGAPRFYRHEMVPLRAINDRNEDVTHRISSADYSAAQVGTVDPRYIGRTREHILTLTFPNAIDAQDGAPMLLADGWVEYPYSQTMFAAWQADATYDPPTIEARNERGEWVVVLGNVGYPAGMPRQMSVPLPRAKLPRNAREIRIRTTQEIYWDRLAIAYAEPCPQARRIELPLASARVNDAGFAARTTAAQRRPSYDYDHRVPLWDARHQAGFYTEFGHAEELLAQADDALAIFGPGEEVHMEFAAPPDDVPAGWSRRVMLELVGWCKDMDFYTRDSATVDPLPARNAPGDIARRHRDELHVKYNTRYRS